MNTEKRTLSKPQHVGEYFISEREHAMAMAQL